MQICSHDFFGQVTTCPYHLQTTGDDHIKINYHLTDQRYLIFPSPHERYLPDREIIQFWGQDGKKNSL